jgi:drug/metabolite transporter (DMT)-like permease
LVGTLSRAVTIPLLAAWVFGTGERWRRMRPRGMFLWLLLMGIISIAINACWFSAFVWTTATNAAVLFRLDVVFVVLIGASLGIERLGLAQIVLLPIMLTGLALLTEIDQFDFHSHLMGDVLIVFAAFGLAANAFIIRHIMRVMDEEAVALYNHLMNTLGFIVMGIIGNEFVLTRRLLSDPIAVQSVAALGILAALGLPLYYFALRRMSIWKLRLFMLSAPFVTALFEWPLWGLTLSLQQWLGGLIILTGLAALICMEWRQSRQSDVSTGTE